jgi:glycine dehydrogenase subunit 2
LITDIISDVYIFLFLLKGYDDRTQRPTKQTLDEFVKVLSDIIDESKNTPELVKNAPSKTPVSRLNEVEAARNPKLRW